MSVSTEPHRLEELLSGFDASTVASALGLGRSAVVRLALSVPDAPQGVDAHCNIAVKDVELPEAAVEIVGWPCRLSARGVEAGEWAFDPDSAMPGPLIEASIITVDPPFPDPAAEPAEMAARIVSVWDGIAAGTEGEEAREDVEYLTALTRSALLDPSAVVTIDVEGPEDESAREYNLYTTPLGAIEIATVGDSLAVSHFPATDIPWRVWEHCGIGRFMSVGKPVWKDLHVEVRSTYLSDEGLVMGALEWEETSDGALTTTDGPRSPASLTSEVLRLLPGGDLDLSDL